MKTYKYKIGEKEYSVEIASLEGSFAEVVVNGEKFSVELEQPQKETPKVNVRPVEKAATEDDGVTSPLGINEANALKAPLPGVITEIKVAVGDEVNAGDTVVVLEAMKMANNLEAEKDGRVTAICVKTGESVLEDTVLVVIE